MSLPSSTAKPSSSVAPPGIHISRYVPTTSPHRGIITPSIQGNGGYESKETEEGEILLSRADTAPTQLIPACGSSSSSSPAILLTQPSASQLFELVTLPSGLHKGMNGPTKKKKKEKELNKILGNDQTIPFLNQIKDRSVIEITGYSVPSVFFVSSTTVPVFAAANFSVASLDNFANIATVYDEYHISLIEAVITPSFTENLSATTSSYVSAVDIDDSGTPTSYTQVGGYASSLSSSGTMQHYHRWSPTYAVATYSGSFTSYSSSKGWIDCSSPNVQHYGLKAGCLPAVVQNYDITVRFTVLFRGLH